MARGGSSCEKFERRRQSSGQVVLETACRWENEVVVRCRKSAYGFKVPRVYDDCSVIGGEFCEFLATAPILFLPLWWSLPIQVVAWDGP